MPPVFIQPGLGDSLNRYLERLGRRGEEQRALQAERDNLQAKMEARQAEVRTLMIGRSINQTVGLYTDEMQRDRASERKADEFDRRLLTDEMRRDRASERRIGEGEATSQRRADEFDRRKRQKDLPDIQMFNELYGLPPRTHDSIVTLVNDRTGIPELKAAHFRRFEESPNTLRIPEQNEVDDVEAEMKGLREHLLLAPNEQDVQADYVSGMMQQFGILSAIHPSGKPKKRPPQPVIGTGMKSESNVGGNNLPVGVPHIWSTKKETYAVPEFYKEQMEQQVDLWAQAADQENPAYNMYDDTYPTKKEKEQWQKDNPDKSPPNPSMTDVEQLGWFLHQIDKRRKGSTAAAGGAWEENNVRAMLAYARLGDWGKKPSNTPEKPPEGAQEAYHFTGETDASLKQKWVDGGRKPIVDRSVVKESDGMLWTLQYHNGKFDWIPLERETKPFMDHLGQPAGP